MEVKGWVFAYPTPRAGPPAQTPAPVPLTPVGKAHMTVARLRRSLRMKLLPPGPGEGEVAGQREAGRALGPGGMCAGEESLSWGSDATGQAGGGSKPAGSLGPCYSSLPPPS